MTRPILPLAEELLGAAKTQLHSSHPKSQAHLENGRWATVLQGFKAQEQVLLARAAAECSAARVPTASREELLELLRSEFDLVVPDAPTKAVGFIQLWRYGHSATFTPGLIREGTKFRTVADPHGTPPRKEAELVSIAPVFVGASENVIDHGGGQFQQLVRVKVRAAQAGTEANVADFIGTYIDGAFAKPTGLFDDFGIWDGACAGGGNGPSLRKLQAIFKAANGQYGPNKSAVVLGLLLASGVDRIAVTEDFERGGVLVWVADESWCQSPELNEQAYQTLHEGGWLGWGCKATFGKVSQFPISVSVSVVLRDKRYAGDTTDILANVRTAVSSYFNDRADWYTWTIDGLVGAVVRSDRRILCVKQNLGVPLCSVMTKAGNVLSEPVQSLGTDSSVPKYHWAISDTNIQVSFSTPQGA